MELYINKKKVDMLQDLSAYLLQRNKALLAAGANTENVYATTLESAVKAVMGNPDIKKKNPEYIATAKEAWVKLLACDMATRLASIQITEVDIKYPILEGAYKAQKSNNSRELEAKKELVKEGSEQLYSQLIFPPT